MLKQEAQNICHYAATRNPTHEDIPPFIPFIWLNTETGALFTCVNNNPTNVVWKYIDGEVS